MLWLKSFIFLFLITLFYRKIIFNNDKKRVVVWYLIDSDVYYALLKNVLWSPWFFCVQHSAGTDNIVYFLQWKTTGISLHQILPHQPTAKVGQLVNYVIGENATTQIKQIHSVACCQSQGGAQGHSMALHCNIGTSLGSISSANTGTVYLKTKVE